MDSDQEDFVFFGTPIEREEEISSRKRKAIAEASGQLRTLPTWKQEVRDEEGRRRFHGAFTGGFSAGFYNTVGSKEGWTPQSFTSSRKNRAEIKQQSIYNFLDEDEKAELEGHSLGTSSQFDTFGFTAVEFARKQAEKDQQNRPSAIPGPVPDEILPVTESIGVKLLLKMGWRRGRSIKDSHADSRYGARREARKALLAFSSEDKREKSDDSNRDGDDFGSCTEESAVDDVQSARSTPIYVLNPKQDLHGLGYDPYKHAPEFREKKRSRMSGNKELGYKNSLAVKNNLFGFKSDRVAPGFGIGALEELDVEDEDIYAPGYDVEQTYTEEIDEPPKVGKESTQKLITYEKGALPGFRVASTSGYQFERYEPPAVPKDFVPYHKFPGPLKSDMKFADSPPPEVPPPEDNNHKVLIEGVATLVARCGKLFEDLSREKNQSNPLFSFLSGGDGHDYYERKLWEEQQKHNEQSKQHLGIKLSPSLQKMTAESRGKILGEKPLERSSKDLNSSSSADFPSTVQDSSAKRASFSELLEAKPFKDDPAKQERFEQFLKEKYQGGLRSMESSRASNMSEAARARERLDFEAAIDRLEKGKEDKDSKLSSQQFVDFSSGGAMQFTSGGIEHSEDNQAEDSIMKKMYPKREEFQWRPSPLLCKRFDLIDPYMGKPPPAPRLRSKMETKIDSLVFMSDSAKATKVEEAVTTHREQASKTQPDTQDIRKNAAIQEAEVEVGVENVERPVDLYKAIFSDDSDNEEDDMETSNLNKVEDPEKKNEAANTTLSRLIAGDFLESLGKELGLEVPPDSTHSINVPKIPAPEKVNSDAKARNSKNLPVGEPTSPRNAQSGSLMEEGVRNSVEISQEVAPTETKHVSDNKAEDIDKYKDNGLSQDESDKDTQGKKTREETKVKGSSSSRRNWGSSSSDDERSRKHSRRHRYRSSDSSTDSSSGHQDLYHSRSKVKRKGSSREKRRSRKHSKHHKHRGRHSSSRSAHDFEKERTESRKEKRKHRD